MKPVMYHYVRPPAPDLPHHPYLDLASFRLQLDYFAANFGFVARDAFVSWLDGGKAPAGVLLTFDDGLRDHAEFVLPVLRERRLFGIFYMCSSPLVDERILDVHKVHLALGRLGGKAALAWVTSNTPGILPACDDREPVQYAAQSSDRATKLLKHAFNWLPPNEERSAALDTLLDFAFEGQPPLWRDIYCDRSAIKSLLDAGLAVGPHSHSHSVPALLGLEQQSQEVVRSCEVIEDIGGSRKWGYCYPHGISQALTPECEEVVAASGCDLAFAVSPADIVDRLIQTRRFVLPRHTCNAFPHGTASFGERSAS